MAERPAALLSFDTEEFDIPREYGREIDHARQIGVNATGMERVLSLLERANVCATFFTTAIFAHERPDLIIRAVEQGHEIASHGYAHSSFAPEDLLRSREAIEAVAGRPVRGFRMARMAPIEHALIEAAGYSYNSSENPIWLPGRYNRFFARRTWYFSGGLLNIPASASPLLRVPLFWLAFKNLPRAITRGATAAVLRRDGYANIYFHPWEYADIAGEGLPGYVASPCGAALLERLEAHLRWISERADFRTLSWFDERCRAAATLRP
jgi:peptidoglycan/xylan/chitin deacetylase (PgdA/CDA1 family)